MKPTIKPNYITIVILFTVILFSPLTVLSETKLKFSGIQGSLNSDISFQVLKEAYALLNIQIEYVPLPGERALRMSNAGTVDGEVFRIANVHKKYTNLLMVPTTINTLQGIVFSKNKKFDISGWDSLSPYKIGIQTGIKFVERGTEGMKRISVDSNDQLFQMLKHGRIDIAVAAYANGLKTLNKLKFKSIQSLKPAVQEYPLYHYLHKKHKGLVTKINSALEKMNLSGRISQIRMEYIEKVEREIKN